MSILVDTNVLLRLVHVTTPEHQSAAASIDALSSSGVELCLVPQVIYEFWVVSTRPLNVNGFRLDAGSAERAIEQFLRRFRLRRDERGVYGHWHSLVVANDVKGKNAHDARLVAAMQRHGLTRLLTFNKPDFERFPGIHVLTPADVLAGQLPN